VVSEATRARVAAAAAKLKYHVDENAARLRTGKTGTLAVVVIVRPEQDMKDFNPFHFSLLGSVCAAASARGHDTLVSFQGAPDELRGLYQEQRKADGMIVIGTSENPAAWDYFHGVADSGAHVICWGSPHEDLDWIRSDNRGGARLATSHLIESGYRNIVCIASETSAQRQFKERWQGYAERMAEEKLPAHLVTFEEGYSRDEQGRRAALALIESGGHLTRSSAAATKWRWACCLSCMTMASPCRGKWAWWALTASARVPWPPRPSPPSSRTSMPQALLWSTGCWR
jgi:DNA-binding LacI/PurR family transcriptional regulator